MRNRQTIRERITVEKHLEKFVQYHSKWGFPWELCKNTAARKNEKCVSRVHIKAAFLKASFFNVPTSVSARHFSVPPLKPTHNTSTKGASIIHINLKSSFNLCFPISVSSNGQVSSQTYKRERQPVEWPPLFQNFLRFLSTYRLLGGWRSCWQPIQRCSWQHTSTRHHLVPSCC